MVSTVATPGHLMLKLTCSGDRGHLDICVECSPSSWHLWVTHLGAEAGAGALAGQVEVTWPLHSSQGGTPSLTAHQGSHRAGLFPGACSESWRTTPVTLLLLQRVMSKGSFTGMSSALSEESNVTLPGATEHELDLQRSLGKRCLLLLFYYHY